MTIVRHKPSNMLRDKARLSPREGCELTFAKAVEVRYCCSSPLRLALLSLRSVRLRLS